MAAWQAYRESDDAYIMLTFDSYTILARSGTDPPVPLTESQVLDGALGGFATAGDEQIIYGSGAQAISLHRCTTPVSPASLKHSCCSCS